MNHMTLSPMQQDYVTKKEFGVFKDEMYDFRIETNGRFDDMQDRFDRFRKEIRNDMKIELMITRKEIREENSRHMGILKEFFDHRLGQAVEVLRGQVNEGLMRTAETLRLEVRKEVRDIIKSEIKAEIPGAIAQGIREYVTSTQK